VPEPHLPLLGRCLYIYDCQMAVCTKCRAELPAGSPADICAACAAQAPASEKSAARPRNVVAGYIADFPATTALIAVNLLVFVAIAVTGLRQQPLSWRALVAVVQHPAANLLVRWGANYGPLTASGPWWEWGRLLTNTFVHIGIVHLLVNMWALLNLGALAEYLFGRRTMLAVYLLTGIAGSITSLGWHPAAVSAGASGAIFGLAGALLVAFWFARLPLSKSLITWNSISLVVFAVYTLAYGMVTGKMDNAAHIGGLLAGVIFGVTIVLSNQGAAADDHDTEKELPLHTAAAVVLTLAIAVAGAVIGRRERYIVPLERGRAALRLNNPTAALAELRRASAMRPTLAEPHIVLGEAYLRSNNPRLADVQLNEAVRLEPKTADAWRELGFLYLTTRRASEAVYAMGRAADLRPKSGDMQASYALALHMSQRLPEAIAAYQKALQINSGFAPARYNLGLAYLESGKLDDAMNALKQYTDQERNDPNGWAALAQVYRQKGMSAEAEDAQRKAQALRGQP
jgi:membrane associated rhomboid family serine protease/Tfp pilus assembly protein PilF